MSFIYLPEIVLLIILLSWMYILYEVITSEFNGKEGMLWGLLVFFVPVVGALTYLVYGRNSRLKKE